MNTLFKILFFSVVLIGFQSSYANIDDKDKKVVDSKDEKTNGVGKKDTVLTVGDVQVDDTLVFDDYDEDDGSIFMQPRNCYTPEANQTNLDHDLLKADKAEESSLDTTAEEVDEVKTLAGKLTLIPNPVNSSFSNEITVQHNLLGTTQFLVIDQSGKTIHSAIAQEFEVKFAKPASGLYFVYLSSSTQSAVERLIVQ